MQCLHASPLKLATYFCFKSSPNRIQLPTHVRSFFFENHFQPLDSVLENLIGIPPLASAMIWSMVLSFLSRLVVELQNLHAVIVFSESIRTAIASRSRGQ